MASRKTQAHSAANAARRGGAQTPEIIDVPPTNEELQATQADGESVISFLRGLVPFFQTATALEVAAKDTLARARTLVQPRSLDEDEQVQRFIKDAKAGKKGVEEHWGITSRMSQFHKRLVAKRDVAADAYKESADIATRLHGGYAEAERRRAAEEQERLRREAEAQAQRDREADLARLEAEALKCEEASADLSLREQAFIKHFVAQGSIASETAALRAASRAGYKDPNHGPRLLLLKKIKDAIAAMIEAEAIRQQAIAKRDAPLEVREVETVKPQIGSLTHDRTTWGAECLDSVRFIEAVFAGTHGIPRDVLMVNPVKLNEYGRSLHERIDLWPGVRHTKKTGQV